MRPNYSHAIVIFSRCCGRWVSLDNLELEWTNWPLPPSQRKGSDITKTPWRISCLIDTKGSWRFIYTILGKDLGLLIDSSQLLTSPIGYQRLRACSAGPMNNARLAYYGLFPLTEYYSFYQSSTIYSISRTCSKPGWWKSVRLKMPQPSQKVRLSISLQRR